MGYTSTPELLKTAAAVATPAANATTTGSSPSYPTATETGAEMFPGAASGLYPGAILALLVVGGIAGVLV
jgi:hypothetical protein